ncbi:sugar phosphate isomerase family [Tautonia plasticadhaerens]|uniref:Glucosamine-6-phosphate deaminase n=1 Tax=Tautonia plasticadhaerens TaxID=2527974 RepID=A0A518GVU2_9BACT|nr:glucosamine-6-phosphate isomerase [Tautonia plasticadhaerens]QDV32713.1 glucosamine-6-phosphate deaminase [Tautonia plasticadhaerens]
MNLLSTFKGSMMEGFLPSGWDLAKIDACCSHPPGSVTDRQPFWADGFEPVPCASVEDFDVMMGHEIAQAIRRTRQEGRELAMILPVGPMGMYRWAVYFLKEWGVSADHCHGFNMDEWSDAQGNTLPANDPGAFTNAMEGAFYGPLGPASVPKDRRWFATADRLPEYGDRIGDLKKKGAELVVIFGIGRVCHIAFWEPHFAAEFNDLDAWKAQTHRIGARLHPLTIEQNALTSFKSRTTLVPAFANTIGPGLFLQADRIIGGADGILGRGMQWQGTSLWMTLRYGPDPWVPSSFMPTMPGRLFFLNELAGPLEPEMN